MTTAAITKPKAGATSALAANATNSGRFPFALPAGAPPEEIARVRSAAEAVIRQWDSAIVGHVRAALRRWHFRGEDLVEEGVQDVRRHLWLVSLPRFDADRGAQVGSFVYMCACRRANEFVRRVARQRARSQPSVFGWTPGPLGAAEAARIEAPDTSVDTAIERAAGLVLGQPEKFLSEQEARLFRAYVSQGPGRRTWREAERRAGVPRGMSSPIVKSIFAKLRALDPLDLPAGEGRGQEVGCAA